MTNKNKNCPFCAESKRSERLLAEALQRHQTKEVKLRALAESFLKMTDSNSHECGLELLAILDEKEGA